MTIEELAGELRRGAKAAFLVRHAERPKMDHNDPSFGDALPLTYEGRRTALKLGGMLKEFRGDAAFYASPLLRTRMTAECIARGMGADSPEIVADELLGNGSFYYNDPREVLELFKRRDFFKACFEYFTTGRQKGFNDLAEATDLFERWIDERFTGRLLLIATHDLYIEAFFHSRGAVDELTREKWVRFLDGGAVLVRPDGSRRYAIVRSGLSTGYVGACRVKISGAVFDFGGVMTTSVMPERVRLRTAEFGIDWNRLAEGFARYRRLMDGGFMTIEEMYDNIWADADIEPGGEMRARIIEDDYASYLDDYRNLETLAFMRELKAAGCRIGILTNMPPAMAPRFRKTFADFIELADAMVISGEERMFKPQRRIYELLRRRIGLPAEELCFFDDVEANCDGARRAGWRAIEFSSAAQAREDFKMLTS